VERDEYLLQEINNGKLSIKKKIKKYFLKYSSTSKQDDYLRQRLLRALEKHDDFKQDDFRELYYKIIKRYKRKNDNKSRWEEYKYLTQLASDISDEEILIDIVYKYGDDFTYGACNCAIWNIKSLDKIKSLVSDQSLSPYVRYVALLATKDKEYMMGFWDPNDKFLGSDEFAAKLGFETILIERAINGNFEALKFIESEEALTEVALNGKGSGHMQYSSEKHYTSDAEEFYGGGTYVPSIRERAIEKIRDHNLLRKLRDESSDDKVIKIAERYVGKNNDSLL